MCKKIWLIEEIRFKHKKLSEVEEQLYPLHLQLLQQMEFHTVAECVMRGCAEEKKECWQKSVDSMYRNLEQRVRDTKQRHRRKLHSLKCTQAPKTRRLPQTIDNFVVNLSSTEFTPAELKLLNKGLNFAVSPQCAPLADIVNNIESAILLLLLLL